MLPRWSSLSRLCVHQAIMLRHYIVSENFGKQRIRYHQIIQVVLRLSLLQWPMLKLQSEMVILLTDWISLIPHLFWTHIPTRRGCFHLKRKWRLLSRSTVPVSIETWSCILTMKSNRQICAWFDFVRLSLQLPNRIACCSFLQLFRDPGMTNFGPLGLI
jgi:hypothetical protein